jgi:hypothetical protein
MKSHDREDRVRRALLIASLVLAAVAGVTAYAASPFVAAWKLREAIRLGHTDIIARKIDWAPVRASLKASIERHAKLVPVVEASGKRIRPTLWQRVKRVFGASMIDRFIETKITPEGLHKLYMQRQRQARSRARSVAASPVQADATPLSPSNWREDLRSFVNRLVHARFMSWTTVQIQVADPHHDDRHYRGTLELIGTEWLLRRLEVLRPAIQARPNRAPNQALERA